MGMYEEDNGMVVKFDANNLTYNKMKSSLTSVAELSMDKNSLKKLSFKQIKSKLTQNEVDDICNKLLSRPGIVDYVDETTNENFAYMAKTGILKKDTGAVKPYSRFHMTVFSDKTGKPTYVTIALNSEWAIDTDFVIRTGNVNVKDLEALLADLKTYAFLKDNANQNNVGAIESLFDKINERKQLVEKQCADVVHGIAGKSMLGIMDFYNINLTYDKLMPLWKIMKNPFSVLMCEANFMGADASRNLNRILNVTNNAIYQNELYTETYPAELKVAFGVQKGIFGYKFTANGRTF